MRWIGASFLDAARWRGALARLEQSPIHREMSELIAADLDFRKTRTYRFWRMRAELGRPLWRNGVELDSPERVEAYFRYCAELIASVPEFDSPK